MTRKVKRSQLPPEEQEAEREYHRVYYAKNRALILEQQRRRYEKRSTRPVKYHARQTEPPADAEELTLP